RVVLPLLVVRVRLDLERPDAPATAEGVEGPQDLVQLRRGLWSQLVADEDLGPLRFVDVTQGQEHQEECELQRAPGQAELPDEVSDGPDAPNERHGGGEAGEPVRLPDARPEAPLELVLPDVGALLVLEVVADVLD